MLKTLAALLCLCASPLYCQSNLGELRLNVTDPAGASMKVAVSLLSDSAGYNERLTTSSAGALTIQRLPYSVYRFAIHQQGFAPAVGTVAINSPFPIEKTIQLRLPTVSQSVTVTASNTLIDPYQTGSVDEIGSEAIHNRLGSIPGRSLQDLVNSQPGWLYEGNAVLHPRGSEYQTQFVINGIPLTDNRSPSFGPEIEANDIQSMNIYTAGIPAEYGRKMGGVIEINTIQNSQAGLHGKTVLSGGSFDTASAFAQAQYAWGANIIGGSASGGRTGWYLNPVVPEN